MKLIVFLLLFVGFSFYSIAQEKTAHSWNSLGLEFDLAKDFEIKGEMNLRFGPKGLESFFPELCIEHEVVKWYKPSLSFRYISDKDKFDNYMPTNRFMFNNKFSKSIERFKLKGRIRYQYEFSRWRRNTNYQQKIDQAIRLKPELVYDIDNFIVSPLICAETFFDAVDSFNFYKYRFGFGFELELDKPHDVEFVYNYDKKMDGALSDIRHLYKLSYTYKF